MTAAADDVLTRISCRYRHFADKEARGRSRLYEHWARAIATDPAMLAFLATLPEPKRQPNLLFAAARRLAGAVPNAYVDLRAVVLEHTDALTALMLARRTQTNEPARCATLLPVLAALPQPLALLEVGASAGLTLPAPAAETEPFILARDGHTALALTDGHGTWIDWISS